MNVKNMTNAVLKQKAERFSTTLYQCAKANPKRKFHALYDKIYRPDILKSAWLRVKENKGSAGIDGITIDKIVNEIGESTFLNDLYKKLKTETYRPNPVKRVWIPKANSEKMRPLGIPTIEDRVVQQATKMILEPIFETTFKDTSYGFRRGRSAHQAMKAIRKASKKSYWVVDIDIKGYFDNINHRKLMLLVEQNAAVALAVADYGYIMETGKIVLDGPSERLVNDADVREFYLGTGGEGARNYRDVKHYKRRKRWLS